MNYDTFTLLIEEGLITTHLLTDCKDVIDREVSKLMLGYKINMDFEKKCFQCSI